MDYTNYIPMYIRQIIDTRPRQPVTSDRWDELWTLIITQGDAAAETLASLCADYVAHKIAYANTVSTLNTLINTVSTNETDIENKVTAHKTSGDHDARYYQITIADGKFATKNELNAVTLGQLPGNSVGFPILTTDVVNTISAKQDEIIVDNTTDVGYKFVIDNGSLFIEEV